MAIILEFIDFIVPISLIREKYPGGWDQCLNDHAQLVGGRVWFDDHLFRDGAMSPFGIEMLVGEWKSRGFNPIGSAGDKQFWDECCVTEFLAGGPTLPCKWLEMTKDGRAAYLVGTDPGAEVGPTRVD